VAVAIICLQWLYRENSVRTVTQTLSQYMCFVVCIGTIGICSTKAPDQASMTLGENENLWREYDIQWTAERDNIVTGRSVRSQQNCEKQIPNLSYWHPYGLSVIYVFFGEERDWKIKNCKIFHSPSHQWYKNINHLLTSTDKRTGCKFIYENIYHLSWKISR